MTNTLTKRRELLLAIKTRAKALGMSDQAIGDKCGLRQQSVNRMLSGEFSPKLDNVLDLADAVGIEIQANWNKGKGEKK